MLTLLALIAALHMGSAVIVSSTAPAPCDRGGMIDPNGCPSRNV